MARLISCAFLALCLIAPTASKAHTQSLADRLDRISRDAGLSGSVIVTKGGQTLLSSGYGSANLELGVANTASTKFLIGSITKQFTSMSIMILQDRGLLSVHDRVGEHLTTVPESWQRLTLHQLLTHTSGIMHSWDLPGFAETMAVPTTLDATLERFFDQPLVFQPGAGFRYSGTGYFLLARIIEEISGKPYEAFLQAEIFGPLGMGDSGADLPGPVLSNRASGYVLDGSEIQNAPDIFLSILTGGGNLYSTTEDMARWDRGLAAHALVSEEAYSLLYQVERESYAYGWRVGRLEGRETLAHAGGLPGFNAFILRVPAEDLCVIVLTNQTPGQAAPVGRALATTVLAVSPS